MRILVFGSTGTGKTSLCNTLSGYDMPVSDSAMGVTFKQYTYPKFGHEKIIITDTVGLNENDKGTVSSAKGIEQLISLIRDSSDGYNLLIHVMKSPRITKSHADNYDFFIKAFTQYKIPCILAVTGCENSEPMSIWADNNSEEFQKQGLIYEDIVSTCFSKGGRFENIYCDLREESRLSLMKSIKQHAKKNSIKIYENQEGYEALVKTTWNKFCSYIKKADWQMIVDESMYQTLKRLGVPDRTARMLSTGITNKISENI